VFTYSKIYKAYLDCRENKRSTINALKFEWNLERNLFQLQKELETKRYKPGRSVCFVVTEPLPREIFAASFKDRIIHHVLVNELEAIGERAFIHDSYSCRRNKGTHKAIKRLQDFIRQITDNYNKEAYYLQLDISGFFMNIDRNILYAILKKLVLKQRKNYQWKKDILWLAKIIIFYKPTKHYITKGDPTLFKLIPSRKSLFKAGKDKGLPIGNYSSQFFANLYLNQLDQFVKRVLKCSYYLRYVDDFIILGRDKESLQILIEKIDEFLNNTLDLKLNFSKTKLQLIDNGIDFLGYFIKLDYVLVRQKVIKRLKNKIYVLNKISTSKILAMINSYYGHFRHAASFNLRRDLYKNNLGGLRKWFLSIHDYSSLKKQK